MTVSLWCMSLLRLYASAVVDLQLMTARLDKTPQRRIRSFVRRTGRETTGQRQALTHLSSHYCLPTHNPFNATEVFARQAPLILEIGFGNGTALAEMAVSNPQQNYLGIEVHQAGVGQLMLQLQRLTINNVRIYAADAIDVLNDAIADHSLNGVHLFFPDPWHKKRHHKRRLVNSDFIQLLALKLKPDGYFHAATDCDDYAQQMMRALQQSPAFENTCAGFTERPESRPLTKFEQRGLHKGHRVWDLIFKLSPANN